MKICRKCGIEKPFTQFYKKTGTVDNLDFRCKSCRKEYSYARYQVETERIKTRMREYYSENVNEAKDRAERWRKANPQKYRASKAKYRAAKLQATPMWADHEAIALIYMNCPNGMHVDHIIPLQSDLVCGLHWEQNLQYLNGTANIAKGNRYWPDMP